LGLSCPGWVRAADSILKSVILFPTWAFFGFQWHLSLAYITGQVQYPRRLHAAQ
jgi:hypothetical protein